MYLHANAKLGLAGRLALVRAIEQGLSLKVASPLVVFERGEVSSVVGSLLLGEASETATAGPRGPRWLTTVPSSRGLVGDSARREHGGRDHDGAFELVAQAARAGEPGSVAGDGAGLRTGADGRRGGRALWGALRRALAGASQHP